MSTTTHGHWRMQSNVTMRRHREASLPGEVLVEEGDWVESGGEIVRVREMLSVSHFVDVASREKEGPSGRLRGEDFCVKRGDRVKPGDILVEARRPALFFFSSVRRVKSPVGGVVQTIYPEMGFVRIRQDQQQETTSVTIEVSRRLQCRPESMTDYLRVEEGDEVQQGQVIAVNRRDVRQSILSPHDGQIIVIDEVEGTVVLRRRITQFSVEAFVPGQVVEVIPQTGAIIECQVNRICGVYGMGGECRGTVRLLDPDGPKAAVDDSMCGQVVVAKGLATAELIFRAQQCGVAAVIAAGMRAQCLYEITGGQTDMTVSSSDPPGLTVIVTEGFGVDLTMDEKILAQLSAHQGQQVYVNGSTQIRAGVVRPEILMPVQAGAAVKKAHIKSAKDMTAGDRVVILRDPRFMQRGSIVKMRYDDVDLGFGIRGPAATVRLDGGGKATVLQANLEKEI